MPDDQEAASTLTWISFAAFPTDSDDIRAEKNAIFLVAGGCCVAGLAWTAMYWLVFGAVITTLLPILFVVTVGGSLVWSQISRNHMPAVYAQIICIIYVTTAIQWSIGGLFDSGFVMAWAFCGPLTALMFFPIHKAAIWLALYVLNLVITVIFDDVFASRALPIDGGVSRLFFIMNLGVSSFVVFVFASYFVGRMQNEHARANKLLRSILPERIARNLKARPGRVAERFDEVGILFADLVDFTSFAKRSEPDTVVETLDHLFTEFDRLAVQNGLEKIKTIGDAYMAVSGLPDGNPDHLAALARFALEIRAAAKATSRSDGSAFSTRIGIHVGSVVAGVIGRDKFAYDLWGDAVNVANRLETAGEPGRIQVSEAVRAKLASQFEFERRGIVELKGVGSLETWWLVPNAATNERG